MNIDGRFTLAAEAIPIALIGHDAFDRRVFLLFCCHPSPRYPNIEKLCKKESPGRGDTGGYFMPG
jgi:hypothetical protein